VPRAPLHRHLGLAIWSLCVAGSSTTLIYIGFARVPCQPPPLALRLDVRQLSLPDVKRAGSHLPAARLSRAQCGPERPGAARSEETRCRFCDGELPDWKPVLTPSGEEVAVASPTMSVTFNGNVRPPAARAPPISPAWAPACCSRAFASSSLGARETGTCFESSPPHGCHLGFQRPSFCRMVIATRPQAPCICPSQADVSALLPAS